MVESLCSGNYYVIDSYWYVRGDSQHDWIPQKITTTDRKKDCNPRTRKRLAFEVAKRIKQYVEDLEVRNTNGWRHPC